MRCRRCNLAYTSPRPRRDTIGHFYSDQYSPHQPKRKAPGSACRSVLAAYLPARPGPLLDFGCGTGRLLQRLNGRGWKVVGIDPAPAMVEYMRNQLGLSAVHGSLPHADLPPESFDAITMAESLEHVHDPLRVLHAARELLTPGGRVVITVPNLDSLAFRWFGADWFGLDLPRHLTHFTPDTLANMLRRAGLQDVRIRLIRHNSWLRHSAERCATVWGTLLRRRLPASLAGWYSALRLRGDGILAVGVR
jgi:SAM-dependent methyltransferase